MTHDDIIRMAREALELLARYENPETRIQVRKPKDGGPIVTMYPHKVATEAAQALRLAIEQAEKQEPHFLHCICGAGWEISADGGEELVGAPPQRQPLTAREVELIDGMIEVQLHHAEQCDRIANRVMAEKQKGWDMERVELLRKLKAAHGIGGES